jgi:hypothetical protein
LLTVTSPPRQASHTMESCDAVALSANAVALPLAATRLSSPLSRSSMKAVPRTKLPAATAISQARVSSSCRDFARRIASFAELSAAYIDFSRSMPSSASLRSVMSRAVPR